MTRWSLFLQTLSLLHHFLGLYCAMPVDVREDAVGAIERMIWWADAPPLSADDPLPGVEPAAAVHMPTPTPTPTPTPSYTPTVLRVGAQRPVVPSPTATSAPTPVRDGLIPLHELRTGLCVDLGKGFIPGQFKNAQRQGPTEAQVVSCDESTRHYRVASIAAAGAYCPRDTRSTITLVDDRAVYCLVHEWKITPWLCLDVFRSTLGLRLGGFPDRGDVDAVPLGSCNNDYVLREIVRRT